MTKSRDILRIMFFKRYLSIFVAIILAILYLSFKGITFGLDMMELKDKNEEKDKEILSLKTKIDTIKKQNMDYNIKLNQKVPVSIDIKSVKILLEKVLNIFVHTKIIDRYKVELLPNFEFVNVANFSVRILSKSQFITNEIFEKMLKKFLSSILHIKSIKYLNNMFIIEVYNKVKK